MANFSLEFKLEAIQDYLEGKESYRAIGISSDVLPNQQDSKVFVMLHVP
ncbi:MULTISPECIES: hypothetical protein [Bacillus]|nr:hypothetical protein [Bacillus cereus]MBJ8004212.1 transposase [Bacillus cereus]HDR5278380.1 transposase [Bacillus thuringiensis]